MRQFLLGLRHLIYPGECLACQAVLPPDEHDFCRGCRAELCEDPHETCPKCGSTVGPHADISRGCPRCRSERFAFDKVFRLGQYERKRREVILLAKRPSGEFASEVLGRLWAAKLAEHLSEESVSVVVPVPLHWRRRWHRGFNQSLAPAESLASALGVPCLTRLLRRRRATVPQTSLTPSGRRTNLLGAFSVTPSTELKGRTVVLVDDVLTTGGTAHAAARILRDVGVARVLVAVLARA